MPKLKAQDPQLRAKVSFGCHLTTKIDQRAQATVLVAQAGEAIGSHRGHGRQECSRADYDGRIPSVDPSEGTGPDVCGRTVCGASLAFIIPA
jgi:hypothetical protein